MSILKGIILCTTIGQILLFGMDLSDSQLKTYNVCDEKDKKTKYTFYDMKTYYPNMLKVRYKTTLKNYKISKENIGLVSNVDISETNGGYSNYKMLLEKSPQGNCFYGTKIKIITADGAQYKFRREDDPYNALVASISAGTVLTSSEQEVMKKEIQNKNDNF